MGEEIMRGLHPGPLDRDVRSVSVKHYLEMGDSLSASEIRSIRYCLEEHRVYFP